MAVRSRVVAMVALCGLLLGCSDAGRELYPLGGHRVLTYQRAVRFLDQGVDTRVAIRERGTVEYQGKAVAVMEYPGGARDYYVRDEQGVRRLGTVRGRDGSVAMDGPDHYVLRLPAKVGSRWSLPSEITLIESVFYESGERIRDRRVPVKLEYAVQADNDTVTVPAGTFEHCLRVVATGSAITRVNMGQNFGHIDVVHTDWYAPGVGLVKSERRETSDSAYLKAGSAVQELVAIDRG